MIDNYSEDQAGPIKVLLIEDNPGDAALIKKYLAQAEAILVSGSAFQVSHVDRLAAGLVYLAEQTFDVALLDLRLPDCQDLETVRRVHSRAPQVPIIVLSVLDGQDLALKAVQAGAQDYLLKDAITSSLLARAIQHAIERHSMRQELRANETRFRRIIENNPDGIVLVDQNGAVRFVNRAAEAMFGRPAKVLVGEPFGFPVVTNEKAELDILQQDGEMYIAEMHAVTIDRQGESLHLISLRDVTERKRVEERVRLVVESTPNAIVVVNDTGKIVLVNSQAEELFGYSREELIGQPVEILVPGRFQELHVEDRTGYITKPDARPMGKGRDLFARCKDGSEVPVEIGLSPMESKDGLLILASVVDITERKEMEAERAQLLEQERLARTEAETAQQRLAFLAEASRVLTSSLDYETSLEAMAHLAVPDLADWCAVHILEEDDSLHQAALVHSDLAKVEFVHELQKRYPPDRDGPQGIANVLRTGQPELYPKITDSLLEATIPDPELRAIIQALDLTSAMIVPLLAREQTLGAITLVSAESGRRYGPADLGLVEELARRAAQAVDNARLYAGAQQLNEKLEARVRERTVQLETANKELESFSYSVSHDLRAPLRSINGFARILSEDFASQLSPEARRYLNLVRENARQMGDLIDDLLAFSRLSRQEMKKQRLDPTKMVREIFEELQTEWAEDQVELKIGDLPACRADPALLKQVWVNLLTNALKYTSKREKAVIEVGCQHENEQPVYFVKDNGVGFDMEYAGKLFGVFQRLHRAEDFEGTGVGLATVQRIVHRHGGQIWAEAEVDRGATFYFTL